MKIKLRFLLLSLTLPVLLTLSPGTARAAALTWDGSANGFWTNAANWTPGFRPTNGDSLFFPAGPAQLLTTNVVISGGGTNFRAITFTGEDYFLYGPTISITNGLTNSAPINGVNTIAARVTVRASQTWVGAAKTVLVLASNVGFTNFTLRIDSAGVMQFDGVIAGGATSTLNKTNNGTMEINGTASMTQLNVQDGILRVDGTYSGGLAVSNGATLSGTGSVGAFACAGIVSPGGSSVGVFTASGTPTFSVGSFLLLNLNGLVPGTDHDQFKIPGAVSFTSCTLLILPGFSPLLGDSFVIVTNTSGVAIGSTFVGLPEGATQTVSNIKFRISYVGGSGNDVTLTVVGFNATGVTRTWDGEGTNTLWSNPTNWVGDIAPGQGDSLLFPEGALRRTNFNDFAAGFRINSIRMVDGGYRLAGGNSLQLLGGISAAPTNAQHRVDMPLVLVQAQTFSHEGPASLFLDDTVNLGANTLTFSNQGSSIHVNGRLSGAGGMVKTGAGNLFLNVSNSFTGPVSVAAGKLQIVNAAALGDPSNGTSVEVGAILEMLGNHALLEPLSVAGTLQSVGGTNQIQVPLTLTSLDVSAGSFPGAALIFNAPITESAPGTLLRLQGNRVVLNANNSYSRTEVAAGHAVINGSQPGNAVNLVSGALEGHGVVGTMTPDFGTVAVAPGESPGILTSSNIVWNSFVTYRVELPGVIPGTGHDQLVVHGSVTLGARLAVTNTAAAPVGTTFIIIDNDGAEAVTNTFFGLPEGASITNGPVILAVTYDGGDGNDVVLTVTGLIPTGVTREWTGAGGNGLWSNPTNWLGDVAPVSGDALEFPVTAAVLNTTNDFATFLAERIVITRTNAVTGYAFYGNRVDLLAGISSVSRSTLAHQFFCPLRLFAPQTFGTDANSDLNLWAQVDNSGFLLTTTNAGNTLVRFLAPIIGAGGLTHAGALSTSTLNLSGTNTFAGPFTVASGRVSAFNSSAIGAASAPVFVGAGAILSLENSFTLTKSFLSVTGTVSFLQTNTIFGDIRLFGASGTFSGNTPMRLTLAGPVVGTGLFLKTGTGTVELNGTNTFTGGFTIGCGVLLVNGSAPFGTANILNGGGVGPLLGGTGVVGNITMANAAVGPRLAPGNSPGLLTASNVTFSSFAEFVVELNGLTPGVSHDQLVVRGALNLASATLNFSLGFTPAFGDVLKIIDNDGADAVVGTFGGLPEGALLVTNGVSLRVSYVGGDGNDVTLTRALLGTGVTRIWDAGGVNNFWSNPTNWTGDVLPAAGDSILFPSSFGAADAQATNDLPAGTIYDQLIVRTGSGGQGVVLHGNALGLINGVLATNTVDSFRVQLPLQLAGPQSFVLPIPAFAFGAPIILGGDLTFGGTANSSITITGAISGVGGIIKTNPGSFTLNASNSFSGPVQILNGTLTVSHSSAFGLPGGGTFLGAGVLTMLGHTGTLAENFLSITGSVSVMGTNAVAGQIALPTSGIGFGGGAGTRLTLAGVLTGAGSPTFQGGGSFVLTGTNDCTSTTFVQASTLLVHGRSVAGDLSVSADALLGGTGVVGRLSVQNGTINPGSSPGVLSSSNLSAISSSIFLFELNGFVAGTDYDQLNVAGTVFPNNAGLALALGFVPPMGTVFTIINNDGADAVLGTFNGLPEGAIYSTNALGFRVSYVGGDGNDVTLTRVFVATGVTRTWDGGGTNAAWSNRTNWVGDVAPVEGDSLNFAGSVRRINSNDFPAFTAFNTITNNTSLGSSTNSGAPFAVVGGIVLINGGTCTISNAIRLLAPQTFSAGAIGAVLDLRGPVDLQTNTLTFTGTGTRFVSGAVSGAGGLVSAPSFGPLTLSGASTYAGLTDIQIGTTILTANGAVGSPVGGTIIRSNATVRLVGPITNAEPFTLEGGFATLESAVGTNVLSGPVTLMNIPDQCVIRLVAGELRLTGLLAGGGLWKEGIGRLILSANNLHTNDTYLKEGSLIIDGVQPASRVALLLSTNAVLGGNGTIGPLDATFGRGSINPGPSPAGSGRLTVAGNYDGSSSTTNFFELNGPLPATGYDQLVVQGDVFLNASALQLSFGFTPGFGDAFTLINNQGLNPVSGTFAGLPEGSLLTNGPVVTRLTYMGGTGNDVVLTRIAVATGVTRVWDGGGAGNNWSAATNWAGDVAPQQGDNIVFPDGVAKNPRFDAGTNAAFNTVLFGRSYNLTVSPGHTLRLISGMTSTNTSGVVNVFVPVTLENSQTWTVTRLDTFLQVRALDLSFATLTHSGIGTLDVSGPITGSGGLVGNSSADLILSGTNTFTGTVLVNAGALTVQSSAALGSPFASTFVGTAGRLSLNLPPGQSIDEPLTLAGRFDMVAGITNAWNGPITLAGAQVAFDTATPGRLEVNGPMSGSGFQTLNLGTLVLNGTDTFAGPVRVGGFNRLLVNSDHTLVTFVLTNTARLGGTGLVGQISIPVCTACEVQPGPVDAPGVLRSGHASLGTASRLRVEINGPVPGTDYDQLDVTGLVTLAGASLVVTAGFNPGAGLTFTIVNNDGADPINGTFTGLPQNALLTNGAAIFQISYTGGDGNDVVLTRVIAAPASTIQFSGLNTNGLFTLIGQGVPNASYVIEATPHLDAPIPWLPISTNVSDGTGLYEFIDFGSTNFPMRYYRVLSP